MAYSVVVKKRGLWLAFVFALAAMLSLGWKPALGDDARSAVQLVAAAVSVPVGEAPRARKGEVAREHLLGSDDPDPGGTAPETVLAATPTPRGGTRAFADGGALRTRSHFSRSSRGPPAA